MISTKPKEATLEQVQRLETALEDWGAYGGYESFEAWQEYQNKHILPFSGGYLEQPLWIREAFKQYNRVFNLLYYVRNEKPFPNLQSIDAANPFARAFVKKESDG